MHKATRGATTWLRGFTQSCHVHYTRAIYPLINEVLPRCKYHNPRRIRYAARLI
uniref:Uncharacterized protein n=1 Tax=Helianthus annuus TaxID=4232 RepID=A0A251UYX5_HELAN